MEACFATFGQRLAGLQKRRSDAVQNHLDDPRGLLLGDFLLTLGRTQVDFVIGYFPRLRGLVCRSAPFGSVIRLQSLNVTKTERIQAIPKALVVEEHQLRHLLKVSAVSGESPIRNVALVYVLYGTGMMLTEIGSITVRDYLREDGAVRASSEVRAEIAYNSNARMLHWSSPRVVAALNAYLAERIRLSHGLTVRKAAFRGLDPDGQLFRRGDGEPFQLTARKTATGKLSYSCDSLSQLYRKLHSQAGLHGPNALAGRRTFAVRLHRKGFDLKLISELLGHATLTATKRLIDGDPVKLGAIVARIV